MIKPYPRDCTTCKWAHWETTNHNPPRIDRKKAGKCTYPSQQALTNMQQVIPAASREMNYGTWSIWANEAHQDCPCYDSKDGVFQWDITKLQSPLTRDYLIALCKASALNPTDCTDAGLQEMGKAWALLRAGCEFSLRAIEFEVYNIAYEVSVSITYEGFSYQESPDPERLETESFNIPVPSECPITQPQPVEGDDTDYDRGKLIDICERAIVRQDEWGNRDTPHAQQKVGMAWAMLLSGHEYTIRRTPEHEGDSCITDDYTIWLDIEVGKWSEDTFYLPTESRLETYINRDWY